MNMIQELNRKESHVTLNCFPSILDARGVIHGGKRGCFSQILSGECLFACFDHIKDALHYIDPQEPARDDIHMVKSKIPSNWQIFDQKDKPIYTNIKYIIETMPPQVPDMNPTGYYKVEFKCDFQHKNRKVFLAFEGVDNALYVWLNGTFVGFSKDSRLPAEFEITSALNFTEDNHLEMIVPRYTDGYYLEDQDMWNLSGIFRDVYLYSLPTTLYIQDFRYFLKY